MHSIQFFLKAKYSGSSKSNWLLVGWSSSCIHSCTAAGCWYVMYMAQLGIHSHSFITENSGSTGDQICVSCPDDGVSKGCVVVLRPPQELQSTITYEIPNLVEEKCFHQEQSGQYTVAVFKQTTNKTLHMTPLNVSVVSVSFSTPTTRKLNDNVS